MPPDPPSGKSRGSPPENSQAREVYVEFRVVGHMVKVSAVDASTGVEVSISGPRTANRRVLETAALNKLRYVMNKK